MKDIYLYACKTFSNWWSLASHVEDFVQRNQFNSFQLLVNLYQFGFLVDWERLREAEFAQSPNHRNAELRSKLSGKDPGPCLRHITKLSHVPRRALWLFGIPADLFGSFDPVPDMNETWRTMDPDGSRWNHMESYGYMWIQVGYMWAPGMIDSISWHILWRMMAILHCMRPHVLSMLIPC